MNFKSRKGYSLIEIGVGLILITIFLISGVTMLKGTYNTYRYVEQRDIVMNYLIRAIESELLDNANFDVTNTPTDTVVQEFTNSKKVSVTSIPKHNLTVTTTLSTLPTVNGKSYANSRVKLLTANAEFYTRKDDETSKRTLSLQTLKIEGGNV